MARMNGLRKEQTYFTNTKQVRMPSLRTAMIQKQKCIIYLFNLI
jgi:hypothetical protein